MALTVIATVVSVPTADRAIVDAGLKAFSTDKPFPPEAVERAGLTYEFLPHMDAYVSFSQSFNPQLYFDVNHGVLPPLEVGVRSSREPLAT